MKIRVGIRGETSQEIEINKLYDDIKSSDIYKVIGNKSILGWVPLGTGDLNKNEVLVLQDLFKSSEGNGHDFGFTEDVECDKMGITRRQLSGYISQLSKKGYITCYDDPYNQFTLTKKGLEHFGIRSD